MPLHRHRLVLAACLLLVAAGETVGQEVEAGAPMGPTSITVLGAGSSPQHIPHREWLRDADCALSLAGALDAAWAPTLDAQWPDILDGCYWLRERVETGDSVPDLFAEVGYHSYSTLYVLEADTLPVAPDTVTRLEMGNERPLADRANPVIWVSAYRNTAPLSLKPNTAYTLVYRARDPYGASVFGKNAPLALTLRDASALAAASVFHQKASYALAGGLLMLLGYHLLQLFVYRSRVNAAFCAMLAGALAYVSYENFLLHDLFTGRVFRESVLIVSGELSQALLFLFTRVIFAEKTPGTRVVRVLDVLIGVKLVEMVAWLTVFELRYAGYESLTPLLSALPDVFRLSTIGCLVAYFALVGLLAVRIRGWATRAILLGNAALTLSVIVYVVQAFLHDYEEYVVVQWFMYAVAPVLNYCVEFGIVVMSLCFSLSVAILTKERERALELQYVQALADTEMSALRAQMNPHFLYNGLNSIKRFVIENDAKSAGRYLSKFGALIRLVLENSQSTLIPLERELDTLRLYLELESLRFEAKFTYDVAVGEGVAPELVYVPPTLLQPYVENAIWHGLLQRGTDGGHVQISVTAVGPRRYRFVVEDDGVGRARARAIRSRSATTHKSLGVKITADRLRLLEQRYGLSTSVEIEDLYEAGEPAGTRVTIYLETVREPVAGNYDWRAARPSTQNSPS